MKEVKFNEKHLKALALIEQGNLKLGEIAKQCGFSQDYFYDLYEGNTQKCGSIASAFRIEIENLANKTHKKIKPLLRENKLLILKQLNDRLKEIQQNKRKTNTRELTMILNALGKSSPDVEIEQFNQFNSMTPEEMANEFRRIKSLVTDTQRGRIQSPTASGTSEIPEAIRERAGLNKKPEA